MKQLTLLLTLILWATTLHAQSDNLRIGGYVQGMPVRIGAELPEPLSPDAFWEYRLQNRLNLQWFMSSDLTFN
jgi:hypothetical protein